MSEKLYSALFDVAMARVQIQLLRREETMDSVNCFSIIFSWYITITKKPYSWAWGILIFQKRRFPRSCCHCFRKGRLFLNPAQFVQSWFQAFIISTSLSMGAQASTINDHARMNDHELNLANLQSDIVRNIIRIELDSVDAMRLVSQF